MIIRERERQQDCVAGYAANCVLENVASVEAGSWHSKSLTIFQEYAVALFVKRRMFVKE